MGSGTAAVAVPEITPDAPVELRGSSDRRQQPTPMFSRHTFFGGRRQRPRRDGEVEGSYVDQFGSGLFCLVSAVALLNILDAYFTVLFLTYGGQEINPIVQASLDVGIWSFILLKSVGIGLCLLFLTATKNFRFSRIGLNIILVGYGALLGWHCYLYTLIP